MMFKALFSLILTLFGYSSQANEAEKVYFVTAQKMEAASTQDEMTAILNKNLPGFYEKLKKDATENRPLLNQWGLSRNIDESHLKDGTLTVPANVLRYLNSILKVNFDEKYIHGHAGVTHTYGYLFSNLQTPYGFKRERYVGGEIESGLGLSEGLLSGTPPHGTLLSNLTHLIAPIAFRDPKSKYKARRLVEVVENDHFSYEARTDIVPFTHRNTRGKNTALLIYSIDFHAHGQKSQPRLITAFPVQDSFIQALLKTSDLGDQKVITLKYNAALPENIPPEQMIGKRTITNE